MSLWPKYRPTDEAPWNILRVVHLHRRASLAASWDDVQRDLESGPAAAVDRLLKPNTENSFEKMSDNIAQAAAASNNAARLKAWWFFRMLKSSDPLSERLTLMWHNHFATSNRKVDNLVWMLEQNQILRDNARAPFGTLLSATLKHPAMLKWLDADTNVKGHPNENLGREMLELFTLGVGNFEESDVQSAARALTGWMIKDNEFTYRQSRHDDNELTLFGKKAKLDGDGLIQRTLDHTATARRLAWRICKTLMGEGVCNQEVINDLANGLTRHDLDISWAVETVLRSARFFAKQNIRTQIAGPAQQVVSPLRALELTDPPPSTLQLAEWSARMGQDVFYPPNVGGWNEGRAWLGSASVIARSNFGNAVACGRLWRSQSASDIESSLTGLLDRHDVGPKIHERVTWLATLLWGKSFDTAIKQTILEIGKTETPLANAVGRLLARPEHQLT